ncbi:MAG TPA: 30S ribosomal protein S11 [Candidatus Paceibacterota bacterium]
MGKKKVTTISGEQKTPAGDVAAAPKAVSVKKSKHIETARVYVNATYNNTVITVTDAKGNVITWASAGSLGFSGPKKATPFAASKIISVLAEKMKNHGIINLEVWIKGIGGGRDASVRSLINQGFNVAVIRDVTPVAHNGPRPKKVRRV